MLLPFFFFFAIDAAAAERCRYIISLSPALRAFAATRHASASAASRCRYDMLPP